MSSFVLLYQDQGLETSVKAATLVNRKSLLLTNCQHFPIRTEDSPPDWSLEVELSYYKISLYVEDSCMPCEVEGYKGGGSGRNCDEGRGVRILKWKQLGLVVDEIKCLDRVVGGSEESISCEEGIPLRVGGL